MAKIKPSKKEELKNTPDAPVTEPGIEGTDTVTPETDIQGEEEAKDAEAEKADIKGKLAPYFKHYPHETAFHITSDGNVFLGKNGVEAKEHQKSIDATKEVVVYEL